MKLLGEVSAVNASLNLLIADRDLALQYDGAAGDNERAIEFLVSDEYLGADHGRLDIGGTPTLVFSLEGMTGMATVHRLSDGRLLLVEPSIEGLDEEEETPDDYLAQLAKLAQETQPSKELGTVDVPSGVLIIGDAYDSLAAHKGILATWESGDSLLLEEHLGSVAIRVDAGRYNVSCARELDIGWGEFSMAWISRAGD